MANKSEPAKQQKQKLFDEWMKGEYVSVQVNAKHPGVEVPAHLAGNPSLTLKLSYLFQGETETSDEAITSYLRFSGVYHRCVLPWDAIWGMSASDGASQIWPQCVPPEVLAMAAKAKVSEFGRRLFGRGKNGEQQPESPETQSTGAQPADSPKPLAAAEPLKEEIAAEDPAAAPKQRKAPHLTRIK